VGQALRSAWECRGCGLRVHNVNGPMPRPKGWKQDDFCVKCEAGKDDAAKLAEGKRLARAEAEVREQLRAERKEREAEAAAKRRAELFLSSDQRAEVERLMRLGLPNGEITAKLGGRYGPEITGLRATLGLPTALAIRAERGDAEVERYIRENPAAGYDATKEATGAARSSMERVCERLANSDGVEIPWVRTRAQTVARRRRSTAAAAA
jgi:hypothetical protein